MAGELCPIGSKYKYWPEFTLSNLEEIGPAIDLYPAYLSVNAARVAAHDNPRVQILTLPNNFDVEGLVFEVLFTNVVVSGSGMVATYKRTVGLAVDSTPTPGTDNLFGIWFGDRYGYSIPNGVWKERNPGGNAYLTPDYLPAGPHNIRCKLEVLNLVTGDIYNTRVEMEFLTGPLQGNIYSAENEVTLRWPASSLKLFILDDYMNFDSYTNDNTCAVSSIWIYSPNLTGEDCLGEIVANFESDKQSAYINDVIKFTDLSMCLDDIETWLWDFGDNTSSEEQNPEHSYARPGKYSVKLTIWSSIWGYAELTKTNYIKISVKGNRLDLSWTLSDEVNMQVIPFQDLPAFTEEVELDGVPLKLSFVWNASNSAWILDIYNLAGVPVLAGVKVVLGFDLIGRYKRSGLPGGKLIVVDPGQRLDPIEYGDFTGSRGLQLIYLLKDEV